MNKQRRELRPRLRRWLLVLAVVLCSCMATTAAADVPLSELEAYRSERGGLVALRDGLRSARDLHSNWTGPPCHGDRSRWYGVSCDADGRVVALSLRGAQLTGALPGNALSGVTRLAALSLRDNAIHGALPGLQGLHALRVLDLSSNRFSGPIPTRYAEALPELARLQLQDNLLTGTVPPFAQATLRGFNVSYNFLRGEVPDTPALRRFPASAFAHNLELCGEAVLNAPCDASSDHASAFGSGGGRRDGGPAVRPDKDGGGEFSRPRFRLAAWSVVVIALIAAAVPFAVVLIFLHQTRKSRREVRLGGRRDSPAGGGAAAEAEIVKDKKAAAEQGKDSGSGSGGRNAQAAQLQFFRAEDGDNKAGGLGLDLDELFRSTAEMLGKGRLGITYRVTLAAPAGAVVVVKRLRNMGHVPRKDFAHTMQLLAKLRHENVVGVVACYHSRDEKLVVYDHVPGRSLFQLLHGNRGEGRTPLTWQARLSIAKGTARGLVYLHRSLPFFHRPPHGNLKSSNIIVLFSSSPNGKHHGHVVPKLTDHGYHPLLLPHHAHRLAAGKCPEVRGKRRLSSRADVYCLGLVLLEVVTGKVPVDEADGDLAEWARLALSHEWSTDILDAEIAGERGLHGDMLRLTEVALLCAAVEPDRRPKMPDVVRMIDAIGDAGHGEEGRRELAVR